ncbi:MAG: hypothetical protein Aurels2KO_13090 [Aureliella sp.]
MSKSLVSSIARDITIFGSNSTGFSTFEQPIPIKQRRAAVEANLKVAGVFKEVVMSLFEESFNLSEPYSTDVTAA